jgi:hypothetical protein
MTNAHGRRDAADDRTGADRRPADMPGGWSIEAEVQSLRERIAAQLAEWRESCEHGVAELESRARTIEKRGNAWRTLLAAWKNGVAPGSAFRDGLDGWRQRLRDEQDQLEQRVIAPAFAEVRAVTSDAEQAFNRAGAPVGSLDEANRNAAVAAADAFAAIRDAQAVRVEAEEALEEGCRDAAQRIRGLGQLSGR